MRLLKKGVEDGATIKRGNIHAVPSFHFSDRQGAVMFPHDCAPTRRNFLAGTLAATGAAAGMILISPMSALSEESDINIVGPKKGYSPQIGTLASMMAWMRTGVLRSVNG